MKKWNLLWILFLVACSNEYPFEPEPVKPPVTEEQEVSIKITFPGAEQRKTKSPSTYAISEDDENTVSSLDIFAFASGGDNVPPSADKFLYRVTVPASKIVGAGTTKTVVTSLSRLPQKQRFVFVANLPSDLSTSLNLPVGMTQQEIVDQLKFDASPWRSAQTANYPAIPMWGQKGDSLLIDSSSSLNLDLGTVVLVRSMAKVEIGVVGGIPGFTVKGIHLCNSSDSGYIAPNKDQWGDKVITKTNPTTNRVDMKNSARYDFVATTGNIMERTIYVPESDSLIINGTDSIKPAFLVIEADYKGDENFYRINFAENRVYHPILRNHRYVANIMGAKEGYKTLEEAQNASMTYFEDGGLLLDESKNINEVVYLGDQYMLGIEVSEVLADWNKPWLGRSQNATATNTYQLSVFTTYPGGWTAALSTSPDWVAIDGATTSGKADIAGQVTINMLKENRTGIERNDTLIIRAGMLTKKVAIRQSGGANSRMIYFGAGTNTAETRIPLAFADAARGGNFFDNISKEASAFDAKIIWQETGEGLSTITVGIAENTGAMKDRTLVVTAKAGMNKSGNAVVAIIKKGSGLPFVGGIDTDEVLWSWHIWCTDDDYMNENYHNPNVPLFMKRALGRYDANQGMFYQWGRKDPFPKALTDATPMDVVNLPVENADNLANAIKNPATFYHTKGNYSYWTGGSPVPEDLWQASKTYYDPCPVGWRVPAVSDKIYWTAETVTGFDKGHLSQETGIWSKDSNDLFWTLTAGTVFESSGSGIPGDSNNNNSSAGRPVRCVKDIQLIKTSL